MKVWLLVLGLCVIAGGARAQQPVDGTRSLQERSQRERERNAPVLRGGSRDAQQLDQLLRMRERSQDRAQRLRQPPQASRPANTKNLNKNTVVTQ
ncbi:hypothetical protein D3218_16940 [Aureimonas flava]|uniref:Uncharacterized protein n=1 Tax=Aureimonas flava TaxID=2320271 RepID=A0A3A1WIE5_9HYPH|nr:hypothetical protein [Aureimonas flava]RIX98427.1 hypothetical protein D3218_16940 [Aureimonas flava]